MSEIKEVTLPVSGKKVNVRNYTTQADDRAADHVLMDGVTFDTTGQMNMPGENPNRKRRKYVELLVQDIDGNSDDIPLQLDNLRSQDYSHLQDVVDKIVEENSPKA